MTGIFVVLATTSGNKSLNLNALKTNILHLNKTMPSWKARLRKDHS